MNIVSFVHEGLGNSSYLVDLGEEEALLVDPDRRVDRYLRAADERGRHVAAVLETHLHADFVSGARELLELTGARVFGSAVGGYEFEHRGVRDGERLTIGGAEIEAIASPGHTPEHLSYLLRADRGPPALFSGGALIVGGAARTDLIAPELTDGLTHELYRTLRHAFSALPDETQLYPTHGGGSFCSTGAGGERTSTLGAERRSNPAMQVEPEEAFARWFPTTFPGTPDYYLRMRPINRRGARPRSGVPAPPVLSPEESEAARGGALVIDVRQRDAYARGHVPGSLSIPFRDAFAVWLGWLAPPDAELLFVLDGAPLARVLDESMLVGYERFAGVLDGGIEAWEKAGLELARAPLIGPNEARKELRNGAIALDVREASEVAVGRIEGAVHIPLGELEERVDTLPRDRPVVTYCGEGERSSTAASILERAGFREVSNLDGGFEAWREMGAPVAR